MVGKMSSKFRTVRCPKCLNVLLEPSDVPVYGCGGCGTRLQVKKRSNSTVDTTSQRPDKGSSGKQKLDQVFVDQEAGSSSNQQPMLNSTDKSDLNSEHIDLDSSNKDHEASKPAENGTVDAPPSVVKEHSSENLKIKQLSDNQEPCSSSDQQSLVNLRDLQIMEEFHHLEIKLEDIKSATNNFAKDYIIGVGGFGSVYKGSLSNAKGQIKVAFKCLDRKYGQGDAEFLKEIMMLSRYKHEHLISLIGFCNEDGARILVYEHASHGSLDRHLSATSLSWRQRLKICLDTAKGIRYLHDPCGTQQRVLHRDIKSSNILLDENWNAKVSDFGLSKVAPANHEYSFLFSNIVGTPGYLDPQYFETYRLSKETDVYSFGAVLFEVLCGRLCFEYNDGRFHSLVSMWKQSYEQKNLEHIIVQHLNPPIYQSSLERFSTIAYQCLEKNL